MSMSQEIPIVLISPEARAALAAEVDRSGASRGLCGGLLFGYPLEGGQRLVVSSVRLKAEVGFGRRDFSLDQTRTSRPLEHAQKLDPKATYCGVWYLHRNPNRELTDEEWVQAQAMIEDPDFSFEDLVCLVLCFYGGELKIYASFFDRHRSARGQAPAPTELHLTTDWLSTTDSATRPSPAAPPSDWYKSPDVVARLRQERQRLTEGYEVEAALTPKGEMFFRLSPKRKYEKLAFYLAIGHGYPDKAPHVFLLVGGKPYRISTPSLGSWSNNKRLVALADELVEWMVFSIDQFMREAKEALARAHYHEAADFLTVALAIEPRIPGGARLLARAQAPL